MNTDKHFERQHQLFLKGLQPQTPEFENSLSPDQYGTIQISEYNEIGQDSNTKLLWRNFIEEGDSEIDLISGLDQAFHIDAHKFGSFIEKPQANEIQKQANLNQKLQNRCFTTLEQNTKLAKTSHKNILQGQNNTANSKQVEMRKRLKSFMMKYKDQNILLKIKQQSSIKQSREQIEINKFRSQSTECQSILTTTINQIQTPQNQNQNCSQTKQRNLSIKKILGKVKTDLDEKLNNSIGEIKNLIINTSNEQKCLMNSIQAQLKKKSREVYNNQSTGIQQFAEKAEVTMDPSIKRQVQINRNLSSLGFAKRQQLFKSIQNNL